MGSPGFPLKHLVLEALFQLKEEKAIELQFTVGEAIACTAGGGCCSASRDPWKFREAKQDELRYTMSTAAACSIVYTDVSTSFEAVDTYVWV